MRLVDETWATLGATERAEWWTVALLEELLPLQPDPNLAVLLACDDETVRAVGTQLGVEPSKAAAEFASDVKTFFEIGLRAGFKYAVKEDFEKAPRPRPVPDFFSLLCLWVLAASRMGADERHPTMEYYGRLNLLLEVRGDDQLPCFEFIKPLFERLSEWLSDDLQGKRGRLILPEDPRPAWVGYAISQTVFRVRDREVLSQFFSERMRGSTEGLDPLPRLRRWAGRHGLTNQALRLLEDPLMADRVRAAIRAAYKTWDGSELVASAEGVHGRVWPAQLHLLPNPLRLHFGAGNTQPVELTLEGDDLVLEPNVELELPWSLLNQLQTRSILLGDPSAPAGAIRLAALDHTALFQLSEDGLLRVGVPTEETVWLLTRDEDLQRRLERHRVPDRGVLPENWVVFRDVAIEEMPGVERAGIAREHTPFRIEGGLLVAPKLYLSGADPFLVAGDLELEGQLPVIVNELNVGTIGSGDRVALPANASGLHEVIVGDEEWLDDYEVAGRGPRSGFGSIVHRLDGPRALHAGARSGGSGDGVCVCGASISTPYSRELPVLVRGSTSFATLDGFGALARHERPSTPAWFAKVGLGPGGRWEIVRPDIVWLLCPAPRLGRASARRLRPEKLEKLDAEAALLVSELGAEVRVPEPDRSAWTELIELAQKKAS